MNAKISVFAICAEAIIYLLLQNLHDCTFKLQKYGILQHTFQKDHQLLHNLKKEHLTASLIIQL